MPIKFWVTVLCSYTVHRTIMYFHMRGLNISDCNCKWIWGNKTWKNKLKIWNHTINKKLKYKNILNVLKYIKYTEVLRWRNKFKMSILLLHKQLLAVGDSQVFSHTCCNYRGTKYTSHVLCDRLIVCYKTAWAICIYVDTNHWGWFVDLRKTLAAI